MRYSKRSASALAAMAALATPTSAASNNRPCSTITKGIDFVNECGIGYGGCHSVCSPTPIYTPPPCPGSTTSSSTPGSTTTSTASTTSTSKTVAPPPPTSSVSRPTSSSDVSSTQPSSPAPTSPAPTSTQTEGPTPTNAPGDPARPTSGGETPAKPTPDPQPTPPPSPGTPAPVPPPSQPGYGQVDGQRVPFGDAAWMQDGVNARRPPMDLADKAFQLPDAWAEKYGELPPLEFDTDLQVFHVELNIPKNPRPGFFPDQWALYIDEPFNPDRVIDILNQGPARLAPSIDTPWSGSPSIEQDMLWSAYQDLDVEIPQRSLQELRQLSDPITRDAWNALRRGELPGLPPTAFPFWPPTVAEYATLGGPALTAASLPWAHIGALLGIVGLIAGLAKGIPAAMNKKKKGARAPSLRVLRQLPGARDQHRQLQHRRAHPHHRPASGLGLPQRHPAAPRHLSPSEPEPADQRPRHHRHGHGHSYSPRPPRGRRPTLGDVLHHQVIPELQRFVTRPGTVSDSGLDPELEQNITQAVYLHASGIAHGIEEGGPNGKWFPDDLDMLNQLPRALYGQPLLLTVATSEEAVAQAAAQFRDGVGLEVWGAIGRMADHLVQKISAPLYPGKDQDDDGKDDPDAKKKQAPLTYTYMLGHHVVDKLTARVGDSLGETARVLGINQTRLLEARNQTLWDHVAPTYLAAAVSSHNHLVMYLRDVEVQKEMFNIEQLFRHGRSGPMLHYGLGIGKDLPTLQVPDKNAIKPPH
ncbi:hypothetical protein PG997_014313 [Apiospora hydei]|uniref:Uncharacterized protein n=1 Tax=Apiospora hydei TaxID=1337664 RepID=A0ABR1UTF9_9PEZI